jgi:hypothetical protein
LDDTVEKFKAQGNRQIRKGFDILGDALIGIVYPRAVPIPIRRIVVDPGLIALLLHVKIDLMGRVQFQGPLGQPGAPMQDQLVPLIVIPGIDGGHEEQQRGEVQDHDFVKLMRVLIGQGTPKVAIDEGKENVHAIVQEQEEEKRGYKPSR